jgi:hypothetical protein
VSRPPPIAVIAPAAGTRPDRPRPAFTAFVMSAKDPSDPVATSYGKSCARLASAIASDSDPMA